MSSNQATTKQTQELLLVSLTRGDEEHGVTATQCNSENTRTTPEGSERKETSNTHLQGPFSQPPIFVPFVNRTVTTGTGDTLPVSVTIYGSSSSLEHQQGQGQIEALARNATSLTRPSVINEQQSDSSINLGQNLTFTQEVSNLGLPTASNHTENEHSLTVNLPMAMPIGEMQDGGPYYVVVSTGAVMPVFSGSNESVVISKENASGLIDAQSGFHTSKQGKRKHMVVDSLHPGEKSSDQYLRHINKQIKSNNTTHQIIQSNVSEGNSLISGSSTLLHQNQQIENQLSSGTEIGQIYAVHLTTADANEATEAVPQLQIDSSGNIGPSQLVTLCPLSSDKSGINIPSAPAPSANQHWFTSKDDKSTLHIKGMKWKQGMWSKEEEVVLKRNIEDYCKIQGIEDPIRLIFDTPKDERKDFYRSIATGISRPLFAIYRKVLRLYDDKNNIGKYTDDEVQKLQDLKKRYGNDWAAIGNELGRSAASVKDRCRLLRENKKTGKWTVAEEELLSETIREHTKTKSGQCITTGINWGQIAGKLGNRTEKQCRSKWLNYLNWKEAGGRQWSKSDEIEIIKRVAEVDANDENELDWSILCDRFPSARSPQWLRAKWWNLKKRVPRHHSTNFSDCLRYLQTTYLDNLRVKIDRQTVSGFVSDTSSCDDPTESLGNESSPLGGYVAFTSASASNDLSGTFTSQSDNNSAYVTSSSYDLSSVHGFPIQFQLSTQPILLPVNSNGIPTNFADHFVIQPVNMTPIPVLSEDDLSCHGSYVLQSISDRNDNGCGQGTKSVELTQTMVQTDLSIPIPSGEISQQDLTGANIQALGGRIGNGLGETPLDETSLNLTTTQQNEINPTEITVTTADCAIDDDIQVVSYASNVAVTVTKVESDAAMNLDSPTQPSDM